MVRHGFAKPFDQMFAQFRSVGFKNIIVMRNTVFFLMSFEGATRNPRKGFFWFSLGISLFCSFFHADGNEFVADGTARGKNGHKKEKKRRQTIFR